MSAIGQDAGGNVWISTLGCGVSHFDGRRFTPPDSARPRHKVMSFLRRRTGELWLTAAQESGGLWSYDGRQLTRHVQPDPANVLATFMETLGEDSRGALWIATWGGLCRYRSSATPPVAVIRNVVTDRRRGPLAAVDLPASQDYLAIEFGTTSPGAVPGRTLYRYRLRGRHDSWRATGGKQVEYPDLPIGDHEFQVRAVDPDLNQSEPVTVRVSVHAPPTATWPWAA